jgi:hypothetical protein
MRLEVMGSGLGRVLPVLALAGCTSSAHGAPPAWNRVVLVELYTSQGCSSCPPADALVRDLPAHGLGRDKVVPLTFHVDYWDHLGWPDPFAAATFTRRQEGYAKSGRLRPPGSGAGGGGAGGGEVTGLYTPQMIVDGQVHFPGGRRDLVATEIQRAAARPASVGLTARTAVEGDDAIVTVDIAARPGLDRTRDWRLVVALAARRAQTHVLHGENGGETLEEAAVVRALSDPQPVALPASGPSRIRLRLRKPTNLDWKDVELVAFVQDERTREVAGAVGTRPG